MRTDLIWAFGLLAGIIVTAALVNRFNPGHRPRVRRTVILFIVYVIVFGLAEGAKAAGLDVWQGRLLVAAEMLAAFSVVNILATLVLSVALPITGASIPVIASDLLIGLGYILSTVGVLSTHGLNPTSAVATGAVVSGIIAISLQSTLGNILGGVALQLDGSIHEGDWVQLPDGKQGKVRAVRWRHTVVETRDWSTIIVPNSSLLANNIIILGKRDGEAVPQRMWVWFNVDFRYPPTKVIDVVTAAVRASPIDGVATDPPPNCVCMDFARDMRESFATYAVRYWLTDLPADDPTNSRVRARIFTALRRAGIPLAVPAQRLWVEVEDEKRIQNKVQRRHDERVAALRAIPLFKTLTDEERETLAEGMSHVIYVAGEMITRQGNVAHWLYVLSSGTADIRMHFDPDGPGPLKEVERVVAKIEAPDVFGEMGLMTGEARSADVIATSDVECYRLGKETFERVLLERPEIATELSAKLAARRIELIAAKEGLDDEAKHARQSLEADRILGGIKNFFGL